MSHPPALCRADLLAPQTGLRGHLTILREQMLEPLQAPVGMGKRRDGERRRGEGHRHSQVSQARGGYQMRQTCHLKEVRGWDRQGHGGGDKGQSKGSGPVGLGVDGSSWGFQAGLLA